MNRLRLEKLRIDKGFIDKFGIEDENINTNDIGHRTIINTELNSGSFLINGENKNNYIVDWKKPIFGYPAQDLGRFLTPTTTFWKTNVILSKDEIELFIKEYCKISNQYKDKRELWNCVKNYIAINCPENKILFTHRVFRYDKERIFT